VTYLPARAQDIPDKVAAAIRNMANFTEKAEEFSFTAEVLFDEILPSGQGIQRSADLSIVASRPNHLAARYVGDDNTRALWIAGEELTALHETNEVYSKVKVPTGIGPALDHLMDKHDISLPLADFVIEGAYESLTSNISDAIYVGVTEVNGHSCHHISCSQEFIDWQLWIDDGLQPLPRRVLITYKAVPGMPRYSATFNDWDLNAELSDSVFEAKIPSDAAKIDLLEIKRDAE
jgi:hypothetical protein